MKKQLLTFVSIPSYIVAIRINTVAIWSDVKEMTNNIEETAINTGVFNISFGEIRYVTTVALITIYSSLLIHN